MRGFCCCNARPMWGITGVLGLLVLVTPIRAEEAKADKGTPPCPNVVVITNVEVNVATWLRLQSSSSEGSGMKPAQKADQGEAPTEKMPQGRVNLGDLFAALAKLPAVRENVVVITNVRVNVGTWLDFLGPPKKSHGPPPKAEAKSQSF